MINTLCGSQPQERNETMEHSEKNMDKIVALCKNRGFVYAGSEIYGGLANSWDYGPLGVEFKSNVKKAWLTRLGSRPDMSPASPTRCSTAAAARHATAPTS